MASAYELMLVLRARNYVSNDLRRAGNDLRRMQTQGGLQNSRARLQVNQNNLATQRSGIQNELKSIQNGARRLALDKAIGAQAVSTARAEALSLETRTRADRLNKLASAGRGFGQYNPAQVKQLAQAAELRATAAAGAYANAAVAAQQLTEREVDLSHRTEILNDQLNTNTARTNLNTAALDENALAMKKLPFERIQAGAIYVEHLGRTFQTLGLFATAALALSAHAASQFQTQATLAATQATIPGKGSTAAVLKNAAYIQKQLQDMLVKGQTTAKPDELTASTYSIYSGLTLKGNQKQQLNEGLQILKEFNKVVTANYGQVDLNTVTEAGIALINNFGISVRQLPKDLNTMQAAVRYGSMTMQGFVSSLKQTAPAYGAAHYTFKQLASDTAFISRFFPQSLATGAVGLARLTETFAKYHDAFSKYIGKNIAPGGQLLPLNQIIGDLVKKNPALLTQPVQFQNLFKDITGSSSTIQARRAFTEFGRHLDLYGTIAKQVTTDNKELQRSFADMSQTPQVRWAELTNELRGLVLEIGTNALPIFAKMAGPIKDMVHWFDNLSPSTKKLVTDFAAWISIGMLFGGTALVVIGALGRMYAAIRLMVIGKAGVAALEDGFLSGGAALRLGLVGALIVAIPLMIKYHTQVMNIVNALGGIGKVLITFGLIIAAIKFAPLIAGLTNAATLAAAVQLDVEALATSLSALTVAPFVIAIVLDIQYHKQIENAFKKAQDYVQNKLGIGPRKGAMTYSEFEKAWKGYENSAPAQAALAAAGVTDPTQLPGGPNQLTAAQKAALKVPTNTGRGAIRTGRGTGGTPNDQYPNAAAAIAGAIADAQAKVAAISSMAASATHTANLDAWVKTQVATIVKLDAYAKTHRTLEAQLAAEHARTMLNNKLKSNADLLAAANDLISAEESTDKKATTAAEKEAKKQAAARKKAMTDAQKTVTQAATTLQSQYNTIYQNNQSAFGQLFNGPYENSARVQDRLQWGGKLTGKDLLMDIKSQVAQFKKWRGYLADLRKRGISGDLYDQIVAAGPSAIDEVKALLSLPKAELASYAKTFTQGQTLIGSATQQDMSLSLKRYRKYGSNIALQIIQGLRDEHTPVLKVFEDMILKDFPGLAKAAHGKAAPKTKGTLKDHTTPAGSDPKTHPTRPRKPVSVRGLQSVTHNENTTYIVTHPDASVKTQVKHAHFIHRNRYQGPR